MRFPCSFACANGIHSLVEAPRPAFVKSRRVRKARRIRNLLRNVDPCRVLVEAAFKLFGRRNPVRDQLAQVTCQAPTV
jgi:hypothetical protein